VPVEKAERTARSVTVGEESPVLAATAGSEERAPWS
jgi:hypothetical protein